MCGETTLCEGIDVRCDDEDEGIKDRREIWFEGRVVDVDLFTTRVLEPLNQQLHKSRLGRW